MATIPDDSDSDDDGPVVDMDEYEEEEDPVGWDYKRSGVPAGTATCNREYYTDMMCVFRGRKYTSVIKRTM